MKKPLSSLPVKRRPIALVRNGGEQCPEEASHISGAAVDSHSSESDGVLKISWFWDGVRNSIG
jgi:hypothetical protein